MSEPAIRQLFSDVADNYLDKRGLNSPDWISGVTERWGAAPERDEWIVPVVAETLTGKVVTDRSPVAAS